MMKQYFSFGFSPTSSYIPLVAIYSIPHCLGCLRRVVVEKSLFFCTNRSQSLPERTRFANLLYKGNVQ